MLQGDPSPGGTFSPGSNAPHTFKAACCATGPFWVSASPPVHWGPGKEAQDPFLHQGVLQIHLDPRLINN